MVIAGSLLERGWVDWVVPPSMYILYAKRVTIGDWLTSEVDHI